MPLPQVGDVVSKGPTEWIVSAVKTDLSGRITVELIRKDELLDTRLEEPE